eukprot:2912288-Heterocapsa_arctica.AAC.1
MARRGAACQSKVPCSTGAQCQTYPPSRWVGRSKAKGVGGREKTNKGGRDVRAGLLAQRLEPKWRQPDKPVT